MFIFQHIKDWHLFGILGGLVVVDVLIVLPWTVLYPMEKVKILIDKQVGRGGGGRGGGSARAYFV